MWPLILTTAGFMLVGFLLLGLPGAIFMQIASPLLRKLYGKEIDQLGDRAWPIAILVSLGWPLAIAPKRSSSSAARYTGSHERRFRSLAIGA